MRLIIDPNSEDSVVAFIITCSNLNSCHNQCLLLSKWMYEWIDGKVSGGERQVRIDRFNASNSSRFFLLLSTISGCLGINLATADTIIIYDCDWNPHVDLQVMARAHRLGQKNKVMIFRLITKGTIEERMMEMTNKKIVLEHLVVGKLKNQNINKEELCILQLKHQQMLKQRLG
ncbi:hypothetical protein L1887_00935 [Cichorium endivia]|nr:hypothetical protein L1887_00935 [Cichorium endivia]